MALIDVNGTQIHYIDEGPRDAPAIIFSNSMFFDVGMEFGPAFSHQLIQHPHISLNGLHPLRVVPLV